MDQSHYIFAPAVVIGVIILLLLIIIGIVTFNAYMFVTADNGIKMGAGGDFSLFAKRQNKQRRRMNYKRNQNTFTNQSEQSIY